MPLSPAPNRTDGPAFARFLEPDPLGYEDSPNLYPYVLNDPINLTDPLGLQEEEEPPVVITGSRCPTGWTCYDPGSSFQTIGRETEIVITGTRSRGGANLHRYARVLRITKLNTQCTFGQARSAMLDAAVPGRSGGNVSNRFYEVSWFGSSLITGPDTIRFRTLGSNGFVNETFSDHYFRYGSVVGSLTGDPQSGFFFSVIGSGNNTSAFRAWANRVFGPEVFRSAARQMNQSLLAACGG